MSNSWGNKLICMVILFSLNSLRSPNYSTISFPCMPFPAICQLVVTSLFRAGWTLGRIVCIFLVWLTIFAIMGVLLWSGERGTDGGYTLPHSSTINQRTHQGPAIRTKNVHSKHLGRCVCVCVFVFVCVCVCVFVFVCVCVRVFFITDRE